MTPVKKTPDRILQEFYRYKRMENTKRTGAFGFAFDMDEGRRFVDEIHFLEDLSDQQEAIAALLRERAAGRTTERTPDQESGSGIVLAPHLVALDQEISYPDQLTDDQLLYYYLRRPSFLVNVNMIREGEEYYGRLFLLELANELHHNSPGEALTAVFRFWDAMNQFGSDPEYLRRLCLSFLIAHSDMAESIRKGLIERDLYWKYDLIGEIRQGRFQRAGLFVKKYARLLKPEEISGDKPFVEACWSAMPEVFLCLDRTFGDQAGHLFRRFLVAGEETNTAMELLPVRRRTLGSKRRIALSDTCYLDSRPAYGNVQKDKWFRTEWVLKEGAQDFLYVIHLYAESFAREYYQAPRRKRTADRFLKKKYVRTGDDRAVILAMKEVMKDARFEKAIGEGVAVYMRQHPVPAKTGPVSRNRQAEILYRMDHEQPGTISAIDYDRFRQAKSDADSVLRLLHNGEIDYGGNAKQ